MVARTLGRKDSNLGLWTRRGYALVLALVGAVLIAGGAMLATDSGSLYYLAAGLVAAATGVLIWRGDRRGVWLYGAMLVGTLAWAIWEVGLRSLGPCRSPRRPVRARPSMMLRPIRSMGGHAPVLRRLPGWPAFGGGLLVARRPAPGFTRSGRPSPPIRCGSAAAGTAPDRLPQPPRR